MNPIKTLGDQVAITFKKTTMMVLITESTLLDTVKPSEFDNEYQMVFSTNWCVFMARTEKIELCTDTPSESAKDWIKFWEYAQGRTDYDHLVVAYLSNCGKDINDAWNDALNRYERSDPTLNDPILGDPDNLSDEILNDVDVKKNDGITEPALDQK
jgi:hypothetical protein